MNDERKECRSSGIKEAIGEKLRQRRQRLNIFDWAATFWKTRDHRPILLVMPIKPRPPKDADDPEQSRRFIETARKVEAEEPAEDADLILRQLARKERRVPVNDGEPKTTKTLTPQSPKKG